MGIMPDSWISIMSCELWWILILNITFWVLVFSLIFLNSADFDGCSKLIKRKEKKNGDNAWFLDKENGRRKRND